jgi:hypothetical protein
MQTAAGSDTADIQNRNFRLVVLDLVTLAERIQASMKLLEQAISGEFTARQSGRSRQRLHSG